MLRGGGPTSTSPGAWGLCLESAFGGCSGPLSVPHRARSSTFLPRAVPLQRTFVFVSGRPRNPPADPRTQPRSWGSSRYVQTLSTGRWQSERHRLWPAAWWLLSWSHWQAPPAAQAEAGNPGQLPWEPACLSSPLLCSPLLLASRAAEASRASPACVCMRGRGGCRMDLAKAGREHMGWVFFFLACGGCPSCRPRLWIRSLSRSG